MKKVAIIHPWMPKYRLEFFEQLVRESRLRGIEVTVFYGQTPPEWARRNDSTSFADGELPTRFVPSLLGRMTIKSVRKLKPIRAWNLIVVEQAVRNIETYPLMVRSRRFATWGHGRTYTKPVGRLQSSVKRWITVRSRHFFAYTEGGRTWAVQAGVPEDRVTVVQNTIDADALRQQIHDLTAQEVESKVRALDLRGQTALHLGGLDDAKRLPFLLAACDIVASRSSDFRLVIAGDGDLRALVEGATESRPWLKVVGPVFGKEKACLLSAADVLAIPGRVGLVAVDSFAAATPIITTNWEYHAPEFEYLTDGINAVVSENSITAYSERLHATLTGAELDSLRDGCRTASSTYSTAKMVDRFISGLERALE